MGMHYEISSDRVPPVAGPEWLDAQYLWRLGEPIAKVEDWCGRKSAAEVPSKKLVMLHHQTFYLSPKPILKVTYICGGLDNW